MRKALVRLAGLSAVTAALATGPMAFGQAGLGLVPQGSTGQVNLPSQSIYTVSPDAGKYLICAASYDDHVYLTPQARALAEQLVQEIRTQSGLAAYVFNTADEQRRQEQERLARAKESRSKFLAERGLPTDTKLPIGTVRIVDEYVVLVGGPYKDDAAARKDLDRLRKLTVSPTFMKTALMADSSGKMKPQAVSPFQNAFICRNPSIPAEKPAADGQTDLRLKEYNADEKYSLLKCRKPFTLVVKAYQGASVVQTQATPPSVMDKIGFGKKSGELLNANAQEAHKIAEVLRDRQIGFEAYVLHTEFNSYVSIGAFDSPNDPRLEQMRQAFLHELNRPASAVSQLNLRAQFLPQPMPMAVPQAK